MQSGRYNTASVALSHIAPRAVRSRYRSKTKVGGKVIRTTLTLVHFMSCTLVQVEPGKQSPTTVGSSVKSATHGETGTEKRRIRPTHVKQKTTCSEVNSRSLVA